MKILRRYFETEIYQSVLFVLVAFLALFAFFDMMSEVRFVGGPYRLEHAFLYVTLGLPTYAYELMPIAPYRLQGIPDKLQGRALGLAALVRHALRH